ncbi:hypothetical protein AXF42_Ash003353 [Apostasia shenzhenica]|uniref:Uncharacterized protein n=1 Tax=Apostasia shenzhenica TaxID=1088818 RepID=A0A2I0BFX1_9ASPA|nr:hypothetical protein AXF42_Ash003353 [Apostasia shenzhenica]
MLLAIVPESAGKSDMNAASVSSSPAHPCRLRILRRKFLSPAKTLMLPLPSPVSSLFRRSRGRPPPHPDHRRKRKPPPTHRDVEFSIDVDDISNRVSLVLSRFYRLSEAKLRHFFSSGAEAYNDLKSSIRVDRSNRIVFSCGQSSLLFVGNIFLWTSVVVLALKIFSWLWAWRYRWTFRDWKVIRRDRSLGGREVVVGRRDWRRKPERRSFWVSVNPLSSSTEIKEEKMRKSLMKQQKKLEKLPNWWPDHVPSPVLLFGKEDWQKEAHKLVKAIMDNRMSGKDYKDDDIIQLREICRTSGAKVSLGTDNARDSFYRAAVEFVLNFCTRVRLPGTAVEIDGEEVKQFICGLAENIGLDNPRAARLICAAVAARTRSSFLQSWAYEVQGKPVDSSEELSNLCQIYQIFPPEENAPEMEMVASGLKNSLKIEQRIRLLTLFGGLCSLDCLRVATEALGLVDVGSDAKHGLSYFGHSGNLSQ